MISFKFGTLIIIMYIYHALINALSAHTIHINLHTVFYTRVEHSPTKTIYIRYYVETHTHTHARTHTHTHTHTHARTHTLARTHTHARTRTHARTHAHTHTHLMTSSLLTHCSNCPLCYRVSSLLRLCHYSHIPLTIWGRFGT